MEKITLKRAEISLQKFNEIAIPHHLSLLKNHKCNIEKYLALHDWDKIKKEEINATRIVKQLKNLLLEMDILRQKINDDELCKFDELTLKSRQNAMYGIREYLDMELKTPELITTSRDNLCTNIQEELDNEDLPELESNFQLSEHQLKAQELCLLEFEHLHSEIEDLYSMFQKFDETVHVQGADVNIVSENVETTQENVVNGESNLRAALRYKKAMYPVCGALLGTFIGGPVGFLAGLKAGGLAAVGCGILGFTGGTVLKKKEEDDVTNENVPPNSNNKVD